MENLKDKLEREIARWRRKDKRKAPGNLGVKILLQRGFPGVKVVCEDGRMNISEIQPGALTSGNDRLMTVILVAIQGGISVNMYYFDVRFAASIPASDEAH